MPTKHPTLSVIIASFNTRDITDQCLTRLEDSVSYLKSKTGLTAGIVVVENGSDDGSADMIRTKHPGVQLIESSKNLGFSGGNNLGLKKSPPAEYYLLINSDVYVKKDTLENSVRYLTTHPDCDVFGCRLLFKNDALQPSAGFLPDPANVTAWMLGFDKILAIRPVHPSRPVFFASDRQVEWVMGAFLFMRRKVYEATHGFDENFFMYMEEVEWCRRINIAGFEVCYTSDFSVTHLDKASSGFDLKKPLTREIIGLKYYMQKYYPKSMWWLYLIIKTGMLLRLIGYSVLGNNEKADIYRNIYSSV